jgi:hypothetical protein
VTELRFENVTLKIDGVEYPVESLSADTVVAGGPSALEWPKPMESWCTSFAFELRRAPHPYRRLRWSRWLPRSYDAVGRLSIKARRGNQGRAFVGLLGRDPVRPWTAHAMLGCSGVIANFSRRCDAKRWCEVQLAELRMRWF